MFTGVVGINLLLLTYRLLPGAYVNLPQSTSVPVILFGSIVQTGVYEELVKMDPVFACLLWKRKSANH